jgi:hypothetical protein
MDHQEFTSRSKKALMARSEGRPDDAVVEIRALLRELELAVKSGVNEWHQQQALGLLVEVLDGVGRKQECRAAWEELVQLTEQSLTYWQAASSTAHQDFERWSGQNR